MGEFNVKIRRDNTSYEVLMGTNGIGEMGGNGEKFVNTCALNKLVIRCILSSHKTINTATSVSPDHATDSHMEHICISKKFRSSPQDVRVNRESSDRIRPPPPDCQIEAQV